MAMSNIGDSDSTESIEKIQPHIIAIGTDWAKKDYYDQMGFTQQWLHADAVNRTG